MRGQAHEQSVGDQSGGHPSYPDHDEDTPAKKSISPMVWVVGAVVVLVVVMVVLHLSGVIGGHPWPGAYCPSISLS